MSSRQSGDCLLLLGKHVKDTVAKAFEVLIPISVSLEDFDLVVAAFGEAVGVFCVEGIENARNKVSAKRRA